MVSGGRAIGVGIAPALVEEQTFREGTTGQLVSSNSRSRSGAPSRNLDDLVALQGKELQAVAPRMSESFGPDAVTLSAQRYAADCAGRPRPGFSL